MLIGRDVHVTMEYTRADRVEGGGEGQIRKFATVTLSRKVYANDTPPLRVVDVCRVSPLAVFVGFAGTMSDVACCPGACCA